MRPQVHDPSVASSRNPSQEEARKQFLAAFESGRDGPPPNIESFVADFDEPERSLLRAELEALRIAHSGSGADSAPGSAAAKGTKTDGAADTRINAPVGVAGRLNTSDGTVDHLGASDGTVDHVAAASVKAEMDPDATTDHVGGAGAQAEFDPDATTDHVRANRPGDSLASLLSSGKLSLPKSVAGYEIISILGRGAMGVVYKARQRGLDRLVALKMILSGEHASADDLGRFQAEANAVAQLQHPGIVQIFEVGEDAGRPFFSLEFVDGVSLHKKIQGTPLPAKEAAALLEKMAEAIDYAHQRGVIHRDLKPANVLLTSAGAPKIGDFGLAKRLEEDESGLTKTGTVLGTPSYMSPEQASGLNQEVGPLSDVYSLGAILYDLLTGRPPFRGTSVLDTLQQLRTREPVPPVELQPGVPRDLETICLKCLQKDRGKRYASAADLAADLRRFLNGEPILARPVSRAERLWRWCRRNPGKAFAGAAAVMGVLIYAASVSVLAGMLSVQKSEAVIAKNEAVQAKIEAVGAKNLADANAAEAKRQEIIAKNETEIVRQTSDASINAMVEMVSKVHTALQSKRLSVNAGPEVLKLRSDVLADLRKSLTKVSQKIQRAGSYIYADLLAAELMGLMLMKLGQSKEPREIFEAAQKSASDRVGLDPNDDKARGNLGVMEQRLGDVALDMDGDARSARAHYTACRDLHHEIERAPKSGAYTPLDIRRIVAHDDIRLGRALVALGQAAEARKYFQEALILYTEWHEKELRTQPEKKQAERLSYLMQAHLWLGIASWNLNDVKGADEQFAESLAIGRRLVKESPAYLPFKVDLAEVLGAYGDALLRFGKTEEARKQYAESLETLNEVLKKRPDDIAQQPLLALTHERLGIVSALVNNTAEAKQHNLEAMKLRKELWQIEPSNLSRQIGFVVTMARAGDQANAVRLATTIRPRMVQSPELMLQVARCFAICSAGAAERDKYVGEAHSALVAGTEGDFKDAFAIQTDPDFTAIRDEAGFKDQIARIKAR
jgi:eukaryotic-like serine/threonine-protein kinase